MSDSPPGTVSLTPSHQHDLNDLHLPQIMRSEGHSTEVEEKTRDQEYDWEHDPANPRNWSPTKKWTSTTIVSSSISEFNLQRLMSVLGRAVHICRAISKFYHGTWFA
jgi:hypothetical protein